MYLFLVEQFQWTGVPDLCTQEAVPRLLPGDSEQELRGGGLHGLPEGLRGRAAGQD